MTKDEVSHTRKRTTRLRRLGTYAKRETTPKVRLEPKKFKRHRGTKYTSTVHYLGSVRQYRRPRYSYRSHSAGEAPLLIALPTHWRGSQAYHGAVLPPTARSSALHTLGVTLLVVFIGLHDRRCHVALPCTSQRSADPTPR